MKKFGIDKIIGIFSISLYNEQLASIGVSRIVHKDYKDLDILADKVINATIKILIMTIDK